MSFSMPLLWIVVAIAMGLIEALSMGLVTMWFVIGGLVAFVAALLGVPLPVQIILFLIVSLASLVLLRPVIMKYRRQGAAAEHDVVGELGIVTEAIDAQGLKGRVELSDHMGWAAVSATGEPIEAGASVRVVGRQSIKLVVARA